MPTLAVFEGDLLMEDFQAAAQEEFDRILQEIREAIDEGLSQVRDRYVADINNRKGRNGDETSGT